MEPYKVSATARLLPKPTAVHTVADLHVTAVRKTCAMLFKNLHLEPFQLSTNDFPNVAPTAMHAFADTHDTPFRKLAKLGRRPRDAAR